MHSKQQNGEGPDSTTADRARSRAVDKAGSTALGAESRAVYQARGDIGVALENGAGIICGQACGKGWPPLIEATVW